MIALTVVISITYFLLVIFFIIGFGRIKEFKSIKSFENTTFSIVIPFRNEAENLPELLKSISQIDYPKNKFEIILVNDDSNDDSVEIIENFKIQNPKSEISIINNQQKSNSPKKDAIDVAIKKARYDWIITTDADCTVPSNWLNVLNDFIESQEPKMVVMPVAYEYNSSILGNFQFLELLSLQGATIGGFGIKYPFLCNGANLCYEKKIFIELDGFSGNDNIASGDDIFMLEKMVKRYPKKVRYLKSKEVIVKTKVEQQLSKMVNQRIRWAAKTTSYKNPFGKLVGLTVLLINFWLVILLVLAIFNLIAWQLLAFTFFAKFFIDFLLLIPVGIFFDKRKLLANYFISSILYPFYTSLIAVLTFGKSYEWKGRKFSR